MSLDIALMVGDEVSVYTDNGGIHTAARRTKAINLARKEVFVNFLHTLGIEEFCARYRDMIVKAEDVALADNVTAGPFADDVRLVVTVRLKEASSPVVAAPGKVCYTFPDEEYYAIITDPANSNWEPTASEPKYFFHEDKKIEVLISANGVMQTINGGKIDVLYLKDLSDSDLTADTPEPEIWEPLITQAAANWLLRFKQDEQLELT